jgi:resuscitation-promoting factor RpfA
LANGSRPPVAPVRKAAAAVLGTVATFVMLFGLGRQSWPTVAIGAALLVLSLGLIAVTAARGNASAWVIGTAHVHSVSEPPPSSVFGRCEMQLVIDAPGLSTRSVKVRDPRVPVAKWPDPGATLPITVALDDPRRVRVLWDEVLTHAEAAEVAAAAAAAAGSARSSARPAGFTGAAGAEKVFVSERTERWTGQPAPGEPTIGDSGEADGATLDLTDDVVAARKNEIVVHETPGGQTIIEGSVVKPAGTIPIPRAVASPPQAPPRPPKPGVSPDAAAPGLRTAAVARTPAGARTVASPAADEPEPDDEFAGVGVTLLVADLDRSVRFYHRTLGLPLIDRGDASAVFLSGSTRLVVRALREVAPASRRLVHVNLEVADIAAAYARLRERGIRFTYGPRVVSRGRKLEVWAAAFRDPDGHGVALTQWRDRAERATA